MAASDPIYIVTLKSYDDLDTFYSEMSTNGFTLNIKRPISRNTHYHMTEAQAVELRKDSRVVAVERRPEDIGITPQGDKGYIKPDTGNGNGKKKKKRPLGGY